MKFNQFRKYVLLVFLYILSSTIVFGQQSLIEGQVKDANGTAIPGATLLIKGTQIGVVSDQDGMYKLSGDFTGKDYLVVSFMGMKSKEISIGGRSKIDIVLEDDLVALEEIIVVGYGSQEKKDITGAVSDVGSEEMALRPNSQVGSLIQGKAAGVQVLSSSGKPSQGLNIRIRGASSINSGSEPLYVIDGVPTSDTRSLNPSDIESVSILKDASAAAIYGAQGGSGVVIITTKSGKNEQGSIRFDVYGGISEVWKTLPVLGSRDYIKLMLEMGQNTDWSLYTENTDWQNEIFEKGVSQNYQLAFSGSNKGTNYYISGGWTDQNGAVRSSSMSRSSFKINIDQDLKSWLKVGTRMAYTDYADVDVVDNQSVNQGGVLLGALSTPSIIGIYNPDGSFTSNPFQNWENPIAATDGSERLYKNQRLIGNVYADVTFLNNFSFRSSYGFDHSNDIYDYFLDPALTSYGRALNGRGENSTSRYRYFTWDNLLAFEKEFDAHKVKVIAGTIYQESETESNRIVTQNFNGNGIKTTNGGSEIISAGAVKAQSANWSMIARANYEYQNKYLATVNFRRDGSYQYAFSKNSIIYNPSFSFGWRLSEERFMNGFDVINDLKLRAGWGTVGNDRNGSYAAFGKVGAGANYPIGGVVQPGTYPATLSNINLKWEVVKQTNIGIDFELWEGRLGGSVDAYLKKSEDLLLNAPLPKSTGFDNALQNIGELENKGIELSISSVNIDNSSSKLKWTTDFNIAFNKPKVVDIQGKEFFTGSIAGRGEASLVREGEPLGLFYGYIFGGVDPSTGNAYYVDQNGESTFFPTPEDRKIIGSANPDFIYGLTNIITYKGFSLLLFLQGVQGNEILNATRIDTEGMTDPKNQSAEVLRRWQNVGDVTDIPKSSWGNTDNSRISTRFIENGSYMRIKTLTLSYDLSGNLLSKLKLTGLKVYMTGENLFTFTKYSGFDPEVNAYGYSNTAQGIDFGTYPQTRNIIAGLNLTF